MTESPNLDPKPDEDDDVCGFTYDHELDLLSEGSDGRTYICRTCGAEIFED